MSREEVYSLQSKLNEDIVFNRTVMLPGGVKLEMIKVQAGTFQMGSPASETGRDDDESQHSVRLTRDYWLGKYEVTQGQWRAVMGNNPSKFQNGDDYPVEMVSRDDAKAFCDKLNNNSSIPKPDGYRFDLPTEAQWEYACRAGTTTALNSGRSLTSSEGTCSNLAQVAWYDKNSGKETHPVGRKQKNAWGFYDMHGNVWEWCRDWYEKGYASDPEFLRGNTGLGRVYRGGCWNFYARFCRSAFRSSLSPDYRYFNLGFRLALVPVQ